MTIGLFDFFSGCGGTSKGFEEAGLIPAFALDFDQDAAGSYKLNFPASAFHQMDIRNLNDSALAEPIQKFDYTVFSGCAPCQPFTAQNTQKPDKTSDVRRSLLSSFGRLIDRYTPDYVFVENVPGIQKVTGNSTLSRFQKQLLSLGYSVDVKVVEAQQYGVPQRRRRLVLLASRRGQIFIPSPTHGVDLENPYVTVRDAISHLPQIGAGETHATVPNHRAAKLSPLNLERIRSTPPESTRASWPKRLQLKCHAQDKYSGHTDVYGRMRWDTPATGLTTRCISLSNGRYGHPEQDRAISVREAAALQTFPDNFEFCGSLNSQAKQIGNAVPVRLAKVFGDHIAAHAQAVK